MRLTLKIALLGILFVAVIGSASAFLFSYDPFREVDQLRQKWDHWQEHKDKYDTVFIGSSRTMHGVIPALFDQKTAAAGIPTRSFNYGVDGMLGPEDAYVVDYILRDRPKDLKWVFVELSIFAGGFDDSDPSTARTRHWHDWKRTSLCVRNALWPRQRAVKWSRWLEADPGEDWPLDLAWEHLRLFGMRALNIGRGAVTIQDLLLPTKEASRLGPAGDGFVPYSNEKILKGAAREAYVRELTHYQQKPARVTTVRAYHLESIESMLRAIRATGAKPVLFIAPTLGPRRFQMPPADDLFVFDFSGVAEYPELFAPDLRVDIAHMAPVGAELFTNHLVEKFTAAVAQRGAAIEAQSR